MHCRKNANNMADMKKEIKFPTKNFKNIYKQRIRANLASMEPFCPKYDK